MSATGKIINLLRLYFLAQIVHSRRALEKKFLCIFKWDPFSIFNDCNFRYLERQFLVLKKR